jgi:hypothetical protein
MGHAIGVIIDNHDGPILIAPNSFPPPAYRPPRELTDVKDCAGTAFSSGRAGAIRLAPAATRL